MRRLLADRVRVVTLLAGTLWALHFVYVSPKSRAGPSPAPSLVVDRLPANWGEAQIGHDALMGRERPASARDDFKAKVLCWKIYEDDRPLYVENCVVWVQFMNLQGHLTQRLSQLARHGRDNRPGDAWFTCKVLDTPQWDHADYDRPLTNKDVDDFLKATWWRFGAEDGFVTLDSAVRGVAWESVTGQPPARSFVPTQPVLWPHGENERAPHGQGNAYAPDVMIDGKTYRMWYGAQGEDGHDRILYAESENGLTWSRKGVAVQDPTANHVNDPSAVKVGGVYYMFFTRAGAGVTDEIALAVSADGVKWTPQGTVLTRGAADAWDGLSVGRPSVLYEDGVFRLWYDGRKDLPIGAPDATAPKSATSSRSVGLATSRDGVHWEKVATNPVFGHDAGGVDVKRVGKAYVMTREARDGTHVATSADGVRWVDRGLWVANSGEDFDKFGQVTPCLLVRPDHEDWQLYFGGARAGGWDHNLIAVHPVTAAERAVIEGRK